MPYLFRIMLHPPWPGINLFVFFLSRSDNPSGAIKHDETGAGRPLVNGADVGRHSGTEYNHYVSGYEPLREEKKKLIRFLRKPLQQSQGSRYNGPARLLVVGPKERWLNILYRS